MKPLEVLLLFGLLFVKDGAFGNFVIHIPPPGSVVGTTPRIIPEGFGKGERIELFGLHRSKNQPFIVFGFFQMLAVRMEGCAVDKLCVWVS